MFRRKFKGYQRENILWLHEIGWPPARIAEVLDMPRQRVRSVVYCPSTDRSDDRPARVKPAGPYKPEGW